MPDVPCGSCTACCEHDAVFIWPGRGDDPKDYDTVMDWNPVAGETMPRIRSRPGGGCIYLTDAGCSIHERKPAMCRAFDCREMYRMTTRPERRRLVKAGVASKAVFEAGRERLLTLTGEAT